VAYLVIDPNLVADAVRKVWDGSGLQARCAGGLHWGRPPASPAGAAPPYCVFGVDADVRDGQSNRSQYQRTDVRFKVYHTDPGTAGRVLGEVVTAYADAFESLEAVLDPAGPPATVHSADVGRVLFVEEEPGRVWFATAEIAVRWLVGRSRPGYVG
jgi:hypothetical protein